MDDFASTALFNLISDELSRQGLASAPNLQFGGKIDRQSKAAVLNQAIEQLGPASIVTIGQGMGRPEFDPLRQILLKVGSPEDMLDRWQRLEQYFHSHHRTRLSDQASDLVVIEHYALSGPGPSAGEDLLIAGVLAALLQQVGVTGLNLAIGGESAIRNDVINPTLRLSSTTNIWAFQWIEQSPRPREVLSLEQSANIADRVSTLMLNDPARNWRLKTVADELGVSSRSLQRQLATGQSSFQNLLRVTRTDAAAALLNSQASDQMNATNPPLATIGYATGFADQAHFSREFKLRFNMTPSEYLAFTFAKP